MTTNRIIQGIFSPSIKIQTPPAQVMLDPKNIFDTFQDEHLLLSAPLILHDQEIIIAANPSSQADQQSIHHFIQNRGSDHTQGLDLIKQHRLSCSLLIYIDHTLILFRDRLGLDTIYYQTQNNQLLFSTELTPLIDDRSGKTDITLDRNSALNYLLYGRPRAHHSLCKTVHSLPAAHFIKTDINQLNVQRYWSPQDKPMSLTASREQRLAHLENTLQHACSDGFSDHGNAIFLSGGLDSSYIAYIAAQKYRDTTHCYTISYEDKQHQDESYYAEIVSDYFKLPLTKIELSTNQTLFHLKQLLDEPQPASAWATICNNALIDAAVADGRQTILSGLGSDEVFGNYDKMVDYYFRVREGIQRGNTGKIDLLEHIHPIDELMFPGVADFFTREDLHTILQPPHNTNFVLDDLRNFYRSCGPVNRDTHLFSYMVAHECHHRIPDLLLRNFNRYAQLNGAHIIYPFLHPEFVNAACCLYPQERLSYHNNKWQNKISLKAIVRDKLPHEILRRKRGTFDFPFQSWIKHDAFYAMVKDTLEQSTLWQAGLFKPKTLRQYLDYMKRNRANKPIKHKRWASELWVLLTLSAWYKRYRL